MALILQSCNHLTQTKNTKDSEFEGNSMDTVLVRIENKIDKSYEVDSTRNHLHIVGLRKKTLLILKLG